MAFLGHDDDHDNKTSSQKRFWMVTWTLIVQSIFEAQKYRCQMSPPSLFFTFVLWNHDNQLRSVILDEFFIYFWISWINDFSYK